MLGGGEKDTEKVTLIEENFVNFAALIMRFLTKERKLWRVSLIADVDYYGDGSLPS